MSLVPPTRLVTPAANVHAATHHVGASANVMLDVLSYDVHPATPAVANAACGTVVAVGELAGEWREKTAVVPSLFPCGECETCRRGGVFVCASGRELASMARELPRYLEVPARWLTPLPTTTSPSPAFAQLGGDALHAYTMYAHANVGPRDICVVLGEGALAWWLAQVLSSKGAHVVTMQPAQQAPVALASGYTHIPLAAGSDATPALTHALAQAAQTADAATHPWRMFVAEPGYVALATQLANPFATIAVAAPKAESQTPTLSLGVALTKGLSLSFIRDGHPDLLPDLLGLALTGGLTWQTSR